MGPLLISGGAVVVGTVRAQPWEVAGVTHGHQPLCGLQTLWADSPAG